MVLDHPTEHVRRPWCVRAGVALVLVGAVLNLLYLFNNSPLDLGEDESHYWEWSRHLDYGYYSKPPGIAWVIRGGVELARLFGVEGDGRAMMPFIRVPAVFFSVVSGLMLLSLARRIFRDDRAGLAVVALSGAAPVFVVGSLLITIDSPMYLCWVLALWAFWRFFEGKGERRAASGWLYAAAGFCALGMLFKPVLIAMPLCAAVAAWLSPHIRARLKTWHSLGAILIVLASQIPVIVWNAHHGWVTFLHISGQAGLSAETSAGAGKGPLVREVSYLGGQIGILGGLLAVFLVLAVIRAIKMRRAPGDANTRFSFLLAFFLPLLAFYALLALWTNTEPNWPAAAYAAGMVLLAGVVTEHWNSPVPRVRRAWRVWITLTVVFGMLVAALGMNMQRLYRFVADENTPLNSGRHPRRFDPSLRLRGFALRAAAVDRLVAAWADETGTPPKIVTNRYDTSSSLAFYMKGQPFVGCIMSRTGGRMNQYDLWPDAVAPGENVLFVNIGVDRPTVERAVAPAFERIDRDDQGKPRYERVPIVYEGIVVREIVTLRCYGFKGWPTETGGRKF